MDVVSLVGRCLISCILLSILIKERDYMEWYVLVPAIALAIGKCTKAILHSPRIYP